MPIRESIVKMSLISPKPIIARTHRTWRVPVGMVIALVEDMEHRLWIVESCPAGTQFWTPEQAAELKPGTHSRSAIHEAIRLAAQWKQAQAMVSRPATPIAKAVRPLARIPRSEKSLTKVTQGTRVRPITAPTRKTLVGV